MEERECPYNWWEYKLAQPLWKTKKRITIWSSNPTPRHIPDKTPIQKDTCTPVLTAALFTIVKTWKQPKCPSTDEWVKKTWLMHTMEYYSAIKKRNNAICSNMNVTKDYYTK